MKSVLKQFTTEHLFDAASALLSHLQVKFSPYTKEAISFVDLYEGATSSKPTKALDEVLSKVANTYYIGTIDANTLAGHESDFDFEKPVAGNYQTMMVFAVDVLGGQHLTRSEMAILTRGFNRLARQLPVILFIREGASLSLATCERGEYSQAWRDGEKLGKVSILRNINCHTPHRGHLDILESLGDKAYPTFDELYAHWLAVFSSELLTKKFYTELSEWYAWVIGSGKVKFPNDIRTTDDDQKYNHESTIRLITRLIFVWFLKQKNLVPDGLFDEDYVREHFIENFDPHSTDSLFYDPSQSKYYRLILQNLFFAMLNRPIKAEGSDELSNRRFRGDHEYHGMKDGYNVNNLMRYRNEFREGGPEHLLELANSCTPYLSGGLFECLDDKPNYMYYDGFSELKSSLAQLSFPDYFFFGEEVGQDIDLSSWYDDKKKAHVKVRGLLNILKSYNFTVEENTPLDQEVSLDPELLGKVFENLLASYNPETNTSARKQTGSFYTPRPIVQYMVDESLIAHLNRVCPEFSVETLRSLFSYTTDEISFSEDERKKLISALHSCKVLDPACGSGAYPMGILQQMVHVLRKLDPENHIWRDFIIETSLKADKEAYGVQNKEEREALRRDIEESFNRQVNDPDYARKLYLIENCIYGVDIQPIATQISKLRFFISLVAEQKPSNDAATNFGIRPLPNLEAKFVAANTLITLKKESNLFANGDAIVEIKKSLRDLNHRIFLAKRNNEKTRLKEAIKVQQEALREELLAIGNIGPNTADILAKWDMFDQNVSANFFDAEWMFGIENGFDVVIGNPPYVQLQKSIGKIGVDKKGKSYEMKLGDLYADQAFETFAKTGDIYGLFYEQGYNMVHQDGIVCYITSNKWMRAGYGELLRGFFAKKTNPLQLIDFGGIQVFESATVDTNILIFAKGDNQNNTLAVTISKDNANGLTNLSGFVQQSATVVSFQSSDSWVILSPIEQSIKRKIEAVGVPLKDWDINIYRGILTGYNEAFIISTEKRDEILANCANDDERQRTEELIRPILRGRDIKRYSYDWADLWLIATFPARNYDIEQYPAVKKYLLSFAEPMLREAGLDWIAENHLADFCYQKLAQTGQYIEIAGQRVRVSKDAEKARKKTSNKWFETQDSISYWDDFYQPKIVYPNMTKYMPFVYDSEKFLTNQKCFIITGSNILFLTAFMNSSLFKFCFRDNFPELLGGTREMSKIFFDKIPVMKVSEEVNMSFNSLIDDIQLSFSKEKAIEIDNIIFNLYDLTEEERLFIGYIEIQ